MANIIDKAIGTVYDQNKGTVRWGNALGGLAGAAAGYFMGNYISAAGGQAGSMIGTIVTAVLTLSGMKVGAKFLSGGYEKPATAGYEPVARSQHLGHVRQRESDSLQRPQLEQSSLESSHLEIVQHNNHLPRESGLSRPQNGPGLNG